MKITFPHMGGVYIPLKTLFEKLQMEVIVPPFNNDEMKNLGCKYSPEYSCMPFKLIQTCCIRLIKAPIPLLCSGLRPMPFRVFRPPVEHDSQRPGLPFHIYLP